MAANRVAVTVLVVLVAGLVAAVPLTGSVPFPSPANQQATAATKLDKCTTITEPGQYELTSDLDGSDGVCLHVQTGDVTLDGNGHTVAGTRTDDSVGLLVYGAARDASVDAENAVDNVTVRDVTAANWARGVQVGMIRGVGTEAALQDVTARPSATLQRRRTGRRQSSVDSPPRPRDGRRRHVQRRQRPGRGVSVRRDGLAAGRRRDRGR